MAVQEMTAFRIPDFSFPNGRVAHRNMTTSLEKEVERLNSLDRDELERIYTPSFLKTVEYQRSDRGYSDCFSIISSHDGRTPSKILVVPETGTEGSFKAEAKLTLPGDSYEGGDWCGYVIVYGRYMQNSDEEWTFVSHSIKGDPHLV